MVYVYFVYQIYIITIFFFCSFQLKPKKILSTTHKRLKNLTTKDAHLLRTAMYNLTGLSKARQVHCRSRDRNNTLEIITLQYICYNDYTQEMFCLCNIFGQMSNIVMFIIFFFLNRWGSYIYNFIFMLKKVWLNKNFKIFYNSYWFNKKKIV